MPTRPLSTAVLCSAGLLAGSSLLLAAPARADDPPADPPAAAPAAPPLAPGAWVWRETASTKPVRDARGDVWGPASGLAGGRQLGTHGGIGDTASDALYQTSRRGVTSWTLTVPSPGRYAVNLLVSDLTDATAGRNVYDVAATDGTTTETLASALDPAGRVGGYHPYHVTGLVPVAGTTLTLTFHARRGSTVANALEVTSDGTVEPFTTTLNDTFDGRAGSAADPKVWGYQKGTGWEGSDGIENYTNSRGNSALDGKGDLVITARRKSPQDTANGSWTSAELRSAGKFTYGYGHVEARMKVPAGAGFWPAFWSKGADEKTVDWPRCGEIDIMENFAAFPNDVSGHVHSLGDRQDPSANYRNAHEASLGIDVNLHRNPAAAFHTYAIDYMPGAVTFSIDGNRYFTAAPEDLRAGEAWPFDGQQQYLLLDLAVGNSDPTGAPTLHSPASASLVVDRVTVTQQ